MKERRFLDIEYGTIITLSELKSEYERLKAEHETEAETFCQYISNCLTVNNGQLEEVR